MSFLFNHWNEIALYTGWLLVALLSLSMIWRWREMVSRRMLENWIDHQLEECEGLFIKSKRPEQEELATALTEKKEQLLNLPNVSFHYVDESRIKNFYTDYFREPIVESMVRELMSEASGEIKGSLPKLLESRFGGSSLNKWISTIKLPDISLQGMFFKYLKETVRRNQVALDLELLDVELSDVDKFREIIEKLEKELEFTLDKGSVEKHINWLKERAAERTLKKMESARGWAVVRGSFLISQDHDFYCYSYHHPVNRYLAIQDQPVIIEIIVPAADIQSHVAGNYKKSVGTAIPVTIYGEVWQPVNRANKMLTLKLTPLAIF